jgi:predicted ABC-type transport system involved in lysophospholipase L1 biosynthesis ATPase subunit
VQVKRNRGVTLVLVTHDRAIAAIADVQLTLRDGSPVGEETTAAAAGAGAAR